MGARRAWGKCSRSRYVPTSTLVSCYWCHCHWYRYRWWLWHCHGYAPEAVLQDVVGDRPDDGDGDALVETAGDDRGRDRLVAVAFSLLELLEVVQGALARGAAHVEGCGLELVGVDVEALLRVLFHLVGERLLGCLARLVRSVVCGCSSCEGGVDDGGVDDVADCAGGREKTSARDLAYFRAVAVAPVTAVTKGSMMMLVPGSAKRSHVARTFFVAVWRWLRPRREGLEQGPKQCWGMSGPTGCLHALHLALGLTSG